MKKLIIFLILFCICLSASAQTKKTTGKGQTREKMLEEIFDLWEESAKAAEEERAALRMEVVVRELLVGDLLLKYFFSNNLNAIEVCVYDLRRGGSVSLENAAWKLDQNISNVIKDYMNKLDVNYAMTPHAFGSTSSIDRFTVHRRVGNRWFTYYFY